MEVTVKRAGMHTTVQDLGRPGGRALGVPLGGAMDRFALRLANLLVGNPDSAAALECTLLGPELTFSNDALVAVTGAAFKDVPSWQPFHVAAGTTLKLGPTTEGCRGYVAIAGGFDVPLVLESASTYVRGALGGGFGRPLHDGDTLRAVDVARRVNGRWRMDARILPGYSASAVVRVIRGAQAPEFGRPFFEASYQVTAQSDRMGMRLKGPTLVRSARTELRSTTVVPGTVQVPPDGQPIVLMAEAQTIGGYPQIAHVISVDLPVVAQLRPGDNLAFREVAIEEAHELALAREHALAMLRTGLAQKFS